MRIVAFSIAVFLTLVAATDAPRRRAVTRVRPGHADLTGLLKYDREDADLEKGSEDMEKNIMATMRKRTMSKVSTWDTKKKE